MIEKADPTVPIVIGGKERRLKYDFRAMVAFSKQTGKNLLDNKVVKQIIYDTTPEDLLVMFWAELLHEEKGLTVEDVAGWITMENQPEVARKTIEAWAAAMPEPKGGEKEKAPLAKKPRAG